MGAEEKPIRILNVFLAIYQLSISVGLYWSLVPEGLMTWRTERNRGFALDLGPLVLSAGWSN